MNEPPFELPMDDFLSGEFSLNRPLPFSLTKAGFEPVGVGSEDEEDEAEEFAQAEAAMGVALMLLRQSERSRVFLDAFKTPQSTRLRKEAVRELARVTNRPEKEIQALPDGEKARLFARVSHKMDGKVASLVLAAACTSDYFAASSRLLEKVAKAPAEAKKLFENAQDQMPLSLWPLVLAISCREPSLPQERREACDALLNVFPRTERPPALPFTVGDPPRLNALEQHLLEFHAKDPAKARPLIAALDQLNPDRAENWLLFGLTDSSELPARSAAQRAWHLAGELYRWGDAPQTADTPFDAEKLRQNEDAIRLLFESPQFVAARELVGEYLIRQLAEVAEFGLLLEVLPQELFHRHERILGVIIEIEAKALAGLKQVAEVRRLVERFPFLKKTFVLSLALRRNGEFETALAELRDTSPRGKAERALAEARLADAFSLELPEEPEKQRQPAERLAPLESFIEGAHPEILYCSALCALPDNDREAAEMAFEDLAGLTVELPKRRAYRLLLALQAQNAELVDRALNGLEGAQAEEMLAFVPSNLLRAAIRALALASNPETVRRLAELLYQHLPDALDPLLSNEELLAASPALIRRLLDKNGAIADPIQRWAGYQRAIDLASGLQSYDLVAQGIDACLAIKDPLLAPHQVRLLRQRIPQSEDLDLRELLTERLAELSADEAKPFLYQLLHAYMGNQRHQDAWRIVETLRDLRESSEDLDQCARVLQPFCQPAANGTASARSDRLPRPVSVGFYGGDSSHKSRTDLLRAELMRKHPGLTVEFDHTVWNPNNLASLVQSVAKFDVIVASNLMRTDISRGIRQRARDLNKTWGYCRNQGMATITNSILNAVSLHLARKS